MLFSVIRVHDRHGGPATEMYRARTRPGVYKIELGEGGGMTVPLPFNERPLVRVSSNGEHIVVAERPTPTGPTASFTIRRFQADGKQVSAIGGSTPAHQVRASLIDSVVNDMMQAATRGRGANPSLVAKVRAAVTPGKWFPPFTNLLVDDSGVVWLQRADEPSSWLVLDRNARAHGQVTLPPRNMLFAVEGDEAWALQFDAFDMPGLVRYRVNRVSGR
jgi:hypothetical protein